MFFILFSVRNGEMLERFREPRTFGELREFVMRLRYSASQGGSDTEQETPAVLVLDRDNFHDWTDNAGLVFILFHADWSRHCKALTPTWESLAENYRREESIMVASIDCNAADNVNKELCSSHGVIGVPSIQILREGVKVNITPVLSRLSTSLSLSRSETIMAVELCQTSLRWWRDFFIRKISLRSRLWRKVKATFTKIL